MRIFSDTFSSFCFPEDGFSCRHFWRMFHRTQISWFTVISFPALQWYRVNCQYFPYSFEGHLSFFLATLKICILSFTRWSVSYCLPAANTALCSALGWEAGSWPPHAPLPGRPLWCLQDRWQGGSCPASTARPSLPWRWGWFLSLGALWCQTSLSTPLRQPPVGCAFSPDPIRQSHPHALTSLARGPPPTLLRSSNSLCHPDPRHLLVSLCHTTAAVLLLSSPNPFTQLPIIPVYSLT